MLLRNKVRTENIQKPLVSVCCVTYNHENLIKKCFDGFVMQQTNFCFEVIVHEDASTDKTAAIVKEYETQYPGLFHCVYQTVNQFAIQNTLTNILFPMARGKYIALCEGDDYWNDPYKLQKQVDFLEANENVVICGTNYSVLENSKLLKIFRNNTNSVFIGDFKDMVRQNLVPTLTSVFRKTTLNSKLQKSMKDIVYGDWILWLIILNGKKTTFALLPDFTSIQNIHSNGVFSSITEKQILVINELKTKLRIFKLCSFHNKRIVSRELYVYYLKNSQYLKGRKLLLNRKVVSFYFFFDQFTRKLDYYLKSFLSKSFKSPSR